MARLQILQLPEGSGDDRTPFLLVVDQVDDETAADIARWPGDIASRTGARQVLCFSETVDIPANGPPPLAEIDDVERAGTTQIVYAHERTRLDLCDALLLSGDTTWHRLVETVGERQRELADLVRENDEPEIVGDADYTEMAVVLRRALGIDIAAGKPDMARWLLTACRELEKSEAARAKLREDCDELNRLRADRAEKLSAYIDRTRIAEKQLAAFDEALTRVRNLSTEPEVMNADQPYPDVWRHGYNCGVLAARSATRPRDEKTSRPEEAP